MKKFLKSLLIIVLVCASVGGTAYFFFTHLREDVNYFTELNLFVNGANNLEFEGKLNKVIAYTYNRGNSSPTYPYGDDRFLLIKTTNEKLNQSLEALSGYLVISEEMGFDDDKIGDYLFNLKVSKSKVEATMDEYLAKIVGQLNPSLGADSIYRAFANYFVEYSSFLRNLSSELLVYELNRDVDLKFTMIDIYLNVCTNTFSNLGTNQEYVKVQDIYNINFINTYFNFNHSFIDTKNSNGDFLHLNNLFIKAYNRCNKINFATNIESYVKNADNEVGVNSSNEETVAIYFKQIFGVN